MELSDLIGLDDVIVPMRVSSKRQLLNDLAEVASKKTGLACREIFDALLQRERLGSTGLGNGIAIPHGKFPELTAITGIFARLEKPIDFDAMDDQPVDLIFLLLAPDGSGAEHLKALARIARVFRDPAIVEKLRKAPAKDVAYSLLIDTAASHAA